jgi:hypothetical protein
LIGPSSDIESMDEMKDEKEGEGCSLKNVLVET